MKNYRLKIFCDFDGTISTNDVWINTISRFVSDKQKFNSILEELNSGEIGTRETGIRQLELVENFSTEKLSKYLIDESIDEHFKDFVDFCIANDFKLNILSGGWDYYINNILKREKIFVETYSTKMLWDENTGKLETEFTYGDDYCTLCETCKRNILINGTNDLDNEISVYIGDGSSDFCVSGFADIVFAKGRLASYCWKNNITYFEYKNFLDIKNKIKKLAENRNIKQRREAMVRRRDILMGG